MWRSVQVIPCNPRNYGFEGAADDGGDPPLNVSHLGSADHAHVAIVVFVHPWIELAFRVIAAFEILRHGDIPLLGKEYTEVYKAVFVVVIRGTREDHWERLESVFGQLDIRG